MERRIVNFTKELDGERRWKSPLLFLGFSASLMTNSFLARTQEVPDIPILMLLGGDVEDVYANSSKIKKWYKELDSESFIGMQCSGAKHELDNEIDPIGQNVRKLFVDFISKPRSMEVSNGVCKPMG